MTKIDKIKLFISILFQVLFVGAAILSVLNNDWMSAWLSALGLFLTFLPTILEKRYCVDYPSELEIVILFFIFAAVFLGEISSFYEKVWWWDILLHSFSGIIMAIVGFALVYTMNEKKKSEIRLSPFFISIFSAGFAISIGVLWEIFEFCMDFFFGFNMQKSGLADTMLDLIVNTLGAIIVSFIGYLLMKKNFKKFRNLVVHFIKKEF